MIYALIGALVMFCGLVGIGITRPTRTSIAIWCLFYVIIAVIFDALVVVALLYQYQYPTLIEALLGASAGAATGLGIHSAHHLFEERKSTKESNGDIR